MVVDKRKTCGKCNVTYYGDEVRAFFRKNVLTAVSTKRGLHPICIGCELSARTEKKQKNRPLEKARRAGYTHADKYVRLGLADNRNDFIERYMWDIYQMAHDIEHAAKNGCPYCRRPFSEMEHGLADITLDIIDPSIAPYYGVNTKWVCATCNREKSKTAPDLWGAKLRAWDRWKGQQKLLEVDIYAGLPLLEGMNKLDDKPDEQIVYPLQVSAQPLAKVEVKGETVKQLGLW